MSQSRGNCAQAVLGAYAADLGLEPRAAFRLAHGLGAGMGRGGGTCGAVSAAAMVIGARYPNMADPRARHEAVYAAVREFARRFTARHGSVNCTALLGCDISTAEGLAEARQKGLSTRLCPDFAASAVSIIEELLTEATG